MTCPICKAPTWIVADIPKRIKQERCSLCRWEGPEEELDVPDSIRMSMEEFEDRYS